MPSISQFIRPSISQFVRPSVCLFVHVFTFEVLFKQHFAPTSRSLMSITFFRDTESLVKSKVKKWSQNLKKKILIKGVKSLGIKKISMNLGLLNQ